MAVDPELKPLTGKQRKFIDLIVTQGLDRLEAYSLSHAVTVNTENEKAISVRANRLFNKPHIQNYYSEKMEKVDANDVKKAVWTRDVSTHKLMKLIEKAEQDIYEDEKPLTMGRLNAIILPAKELNLMHGFNQTNVSLEGTVVQICGEDELPD